MFSPTLNPYKFRYLVTSFSGGAGIPCVYLPEQPAPHLIANCGLPVEQQIWRRTELPKEWRKWRKEEREGLKRDPDFYHPQLNAFIAQEWRRRMEGYWIYIKGEAVYLTGANYYYLNWWKADFGYPKYRDTDKEVWYFAKYCEEDGFCYGPMYNTRRRSGKSAIMGCWLVEGITRMKNAYGGIQGEKDDKVAPFFALAVINPFHKLPDFFQPIYQTDSKNVKDIKFFAPVKLGRSRLDDDEEEVETLESWINWKGSDKGAYDSRKLHRAVMEEPGKTVEVNVRERHDVIKPCHEEDDEIIGKSFYGTTVEEMEGAGGVYEQLAEESDFDQKQANGQTISGLYFSFMPAFCNYIFDGWGFPKIEEATKKLILKIEAQRGDPKKYAAVKRKYPFTVHDAFYTSADKCEFNAQILQDRYNELLKMPNHVTRGDFHFEESGRVVWRANRTSGKCQVAWLPEDDADTNKVEATGVDEQGVTQWRPLNDKHFGIGIDPIQYGQTVDMKRASKPVIYVLRKYDPLIDGFMDDMIRLERATEVYENGVLIKPKYQYQTGLDIVQYDFRPNEPTFFYEYVIKLCIFFGCKVQVEAQKAGGLIAHMTARGYGEFIDSKFVMDPDEKKQQKAEEFLGTAATAGLIQEYTSLLATHVEYFGHCLHFREEILDMLKFNPLKPTKHDYTVAKGFTRFTEAKKVKVERPPVDIYEIMRKFNNSGATSKVIA